MNSTIQEFDDDFSIQSQITQPESIFIPTRLIHQTESPMKIPSKFESIKENQTKMKESNGSEDAMNDSNLMRLKGGFLIPICLPIPFHCCFPFCWFPFCWCGS
ncbi:hypothetical protein DFH28DRAFT_928115 [Melampsora americana]|nr:hypothetical protein DFH28DRAFT_928115 [Melampsora americana]